MTGTSCGGELLPAPPRGGAHSWRRARDGERPAARLSAGTVVTGRLSSKSANFAAAYGGFGSAHLGSCQIDFASAEAVAVQSVRSGRSVGALVRAASRLTWWICDRCGSFLIWDGEPPERPLLGQALIRARFSLLPVDVRADGIPDCDLGAVQHVMES